MGSTGKRGKRAAAVGTSPFGRLLREWRLRGGLSQLRLATEAGVSPRHLSFVETGRAQPSREMVLRLSEALDVPLRDRNDLLSAAGFAAIYRERAIGHDELAPVERMIGFLLERCEPFPAYLLDRRMRILRSNRAASAILSPFARDHAIWHEEPRNLLRLTLHPEGFRSSIVNFDEVASALLVRLARTAAATPSDPELEALLTELRALPGLPDAGRPSDRTRPVPPILAMHMKSGTLELRFFSMLSTLGTPQDVTLQDLHVETLMPADEASEALMRALGEAAAGPEVGKGSA
ncbi:MAG: helix-turn-helix transcriptional regulator [Deltaproteobacteria bacterium]|nr:helix-turn-helix transcriptional regulator [Deltaproteobacteria bacterium]